MSARWNKFDRFPRTMREGFGPYHHSSMIQEAQKDWREAEDLNRYAIFCILLIAILFAAVVIWNI